MRRPQPGPQMKPLPARLRRLIEPAGVFHQLTMIMELVTAEGSARTQVPEITEFLGTWRGRRASSEGR
jgi:hypothetical protein